MLSEHKDYKIKKPYVEVATENYKIIQIHKNFTDYLHNRKSSPKKEARGLGKSEPQK